MRLPKQQGKSQELGQILITAPTTAEAHEDRHRAIASLDVGGSFEIVAISAAVYWRVSEKEDVCAHESVALGHVETSP